MYNWCTFCWMYSMVIIIEWNLQSVGLWYIYAWVCLMLLWYMLVSVPVGLWYMLECAWCCDAVMTWVNPSVIDMLGFEQRRCKQKNSPRLSSRKVWSGHQIKYRNFHSRVNDDTVIVSHQHLWRRYNRKNIARCRIAKYNRRLSYQTMYRSSADEYYSITILQYHIITI